MAFRWEDNDAGVACEITGVLNVCDVAEIREELIACLTARSRLVLDLKGVCDCDTAGVQLLCSAHKSAAALGKEWVIVSTPTAVRDAAARVGLRLIEDLGCRKEV
jgi:anti-anti-sigma factor